MLLCWKFNTLIWEFNNFLFYRIVRFFNFNIKFNFVNCPPTTRQLVKAYHNQIKRAHKGTCAQSLGKLIYISLMSDRCYFFLFLHGQSLVTESMFANSVSGTSTGSTISDIIFDLELDLTQVYPLFL